MMKENNTESESRTELEQNIDEIIEGIQDNIEKLLILVF